MLRSLIILVSLVVAAHAQTLSLLGVGDQPVGTAVMPAPPVLGVPGRPFSTGFNQGWFHNHYGSQWTTGWDEAEVLRLIRGTRAHAGRVLRVWLFEGKAEPTLAGDKLAHVERALELAEQEGVELYITFFDANIVLQNPTQAERDRWWNLLNDKYGAGARFRADVVGPLCEMMARHRKAVFAVDLVNEINAFVDRNWVENGWTGVRRFVDVTRAAIKARLDVPVTASFGWGGAEQLVVDRKIPQASVDFYDFHVYDDAGEIASFNEIQALARTFPVYLGEYGQKSPAFDDALQARVTEAFLRNARRARLVGAFAWRLSDIRPGHNPEARHSYEAFGRWRPAAEVHRRVSIDLGAR